MTKDEALRMAIDFLNRDGFIEEYEIQQIIEACKDALAETQEPVSYHPTSQEQSVMHQAMMRSSKLVHKATPPSREWVGLSDAEISDCVETGIAKWKKESTETYYSDMDLFIYREFEAKLREKNND